MKGLKAMSNKFNNMAFYIFTGMLVLAFLAVYPQGQLYAQNNDLENTTMDIAWSPDRTLLATANPSGQIRVWTQSGELLRTLSGHEILARSVAWSPDGKLLATGGEDAFIRIWDVNTGELIREVESFPYGPHAMAWQPTGEYFIAASSDTFQVWKTSTWETITHGLGATVPDAQWNSNGTLFAYASMGRVGVATIENDKVDLTHFERQHTAIIESVDWSPDESQLVSAGGRDGSVRLWDVATGKQIRVLLQTNEIVTNAAFTNTEGTQITAITEEGSVYVLNTLTAEVEQKQTKNARLWDMDWNSEFGLLAMSGLVINPQDTSLNSGDTNLMTTDQSTGFLEIIPLTQESEKQTTP